MFHFSNISLCQVLFVLSAQAGAHCSICSVWKKELEEVAIFFFFNMHFKKK